MQKKILLALSSVIALVTCLSIFSFESIDLSSQAPSDDHSNREIATETKNICSITINSDDEIKAFKQKLSSNSHFKFTELVSGDQNWFSRACNQNVQCDVLVISGHFGGTFFGETGYHLTLSELETQSCSRRCTGILEKPKEIYLFGCNTLATKADAATRSPENYLQVLLNDGLDRSFAERVVEARYGASGESHLNRMKRAFPGVPAIYGFCDKAPLGSEAGPVVKNYLASQSKGYLEKLNRLEVAQKTLQPYSSETIKNITNSTLSSSFKSIGRCFRQTTGVGTNDETAQRICSVRNTQNSLESRALDLDYLMRTEQNLSYIELCNDFFIEIKKRKSLTPTEQNAIQKIVNNTKLRDDLASLMGKVSFFLAYDYGLLGAQLGLKVSEISPAVSKSFIKMVNQGLTLESINLMVNSNFKSPFKNLIQIDYSSLDEKVWSNGFSIEAIGLTETKDVQIIKRIQSLMSLNVSFKKQLLVTLIRLNAIDVELKDSLIQMLHEPDVDVRANAVKALSVLKNYDVNTVNEIISLMNHEKDSWVLKKAVLYFIDNTFDTSVIQNHLAQMLQHSDDDVRYYAAMALGLRQLNDRSIFDALIKSLQDKTAPVQAYSRLSLKKNATKIPQDLVELIKSQSPQDYIYIFNSK